MTEVVVGIGARSGVTAEAVRRALREVVGNNVVRGIATIDRRAGEPGIVVVAQELGVAVRGFSAAELDRVVVPNPQDRVRDAVGTASVAEAAALAAGNGPLLMGKRAISGVVIAVAPWRSDIG
ncbi:cobalamin biosynthesis protein [Nocardia sp. NPDC127579]|uniref:cobalamin biosynthesis protein n=1 Tax=Nocardia sp. NPDC127579 TaxID=3345402 RepID=UPI003640569D